MRQRKYLRSLFLVVLSVLLYYSWSSAVSPQGSVVFAHAFVIGSDPVDGSTINTVPRVVRIFFDAPISPASSANIYTPDEQIADAARSSISSTNPHELDTPLLPPAQLPQGGYTVRWTALASIDGHTTQGVIGFNIGHSSTGLPGQTILGPGTSNKLPELDLIGILAVAWEWLVLVALTFWIGILITEGLLLAGVKRTATLLAHTSKRSIPLQWLCLATLLIGEIITLILRTSQLTQALNGGGLNFIVAGQILSGTIYGYLWLLRIALILVALGLLWWTTRQRNNTNNTRRIRLPGSGFKHMRQRVTQEYSPVKEELVEKEKATAIPASSRQYTVLWLLLAGLMLLTLALSGDAAALAQPHISTIVLDWLYLTARSIWLGTLAYLGYVLLPLLPIAEPDRYTEVLATLLRRFHPLMLGALGVLLVSGFYLAEGSLSDVHQLVGDAYGRTLLVEYILVAIMLLLSAYALFVLHPALARQAVLVPVVHAEMPAKRARQSALEQKARRLKQAFNLQSWLGAGVLFCAALMSFFAPPIVFPAINYAQSTTSTLPITTPTTPTTQIMQTQQVGNLSITLQVLPGRVGYANTVIVTMQDNGSGNFITDAQVQISINMQIMDMGTSRATAKAGNPTYIATFAKNTAFAMLGAWVIKLNIQRPHQAPIQATFLVTLAGA